MARYLNVMRQRAYSEEEYQKDAWNEILEEHNWYRKINENGDHSYNNIKVVKDGVTKPSEADFNAKVQELKDAYASAQYKRQRTTSYPSIQEQLDMQYWDKVNGTTTWQDAIAKVKTDIPKE